MCRKILTLGIALLLAALAVSVGPVRAVPPGTPAADSALNYDPFTGTSSAAGSSSSSSGAAVPNSAAVTAPSANTTPVTAICPPTIYVCVHDAPTVVQSSTAKTTATFTVTLTAASSSTITVHYYTSDGTDGGTAGVAYTATSGTLTFSPGQTSKTVTVTVLPQAGDSTTEHFYLNISNATGGAVIACTKGVATLQPPVIKITGTSPPPAKQSTTAYVPMTFTVQLSAPATTPVTVKYDTSDGSAIHNVDYLPVSGTLTFPPGTTTETVLVYVKPGTATTNRVYYLNLSDPAGAPGLTIVDPKMTGTIIGQNSANVATLSINNIYINQSKTSNTSGSFTISLSTAAKTPVTLHYVTENGTGPSGAVAGVDYIPTSGNLTFPVGTTSLKLPVTVLAGNNAIQKYFNVVLSNVVGAPVSMAVGTAYIVPPMTGVSVNDAPPVQQVGVASKTATFTVTLSAESSMPITVEYATANGPVGPTGAVAGTDYVMTSGFLTFAPYTMYKTVNVTVLPGSNPLTRTFYLNLSNASAGVTITRAQGVGTILGHDCGCMCANVNDVAVMQDKTVNKAATFSVILTNSSTNTITVHYATADGTAKAGKDYVAASGTLTFSPGQTSKTVNVTILAEANQNSVISFFLNLSNPTNALACRPQGTCTIYPAAVTVSTNNSPPVNRELTANTTASFTLSLSAKSNSPVTVQYATADGTAVKNVDYAPASGSATFPANTLTQTVNVTVLPGSQNGDKTFYLNLSNPSGATIAQAQGSALIYGTGGTLPVLRINNISVDQSKTSNVTSTFTVTLSAPSTSNVTVHYATADPAHPAEGYIAQAGEDYVATSGTLTFSPGQTAKTVNVTILPENNENVLEVFYVNLSSANGATIAVSQGIGSIIPPIIDIYVANPALVQRSATADTTVAFAVSLSSVSNQPITVMYSTSDGTAVHNTDYIAASGTLTFSPGQTTKMVDVTTKPGSGSMTKTFFLNLTSAAGLDATISVSKATAQIKG